MTHAFFFPWQQMAWEQLVKQRARLPHALLLQGREGCGHLEFGLGVARALLCEQAGQDTAACGTCKSCVWFDHGDHPDFRLLEPVSGGGDDPGNDNEARPTGKTWITVQQVRALSDFVTLSSHRAGLKIVLVHPAESLNTASANALLKMLEEPPPGVLFILATAHARRLLPTIVSRCIRIMLPLPTLAQATAWLHQHNISEATDKLAYAGGQPLTVLAMDDAQKRRLHAFQQELTQGKHMNVFAITGLFGRDDMAVALDALQKWVHDVAAAKLATQVRYHLKSAQPIQRIAGEVHLPRMLRFQRRLDEAKRHAQHPLNVELQLGALLTEYTQLFCADGAT